MNIGALSHDVLLQERGAGADSIGQPIESWSTVARLWADVRYLNGVEAIKAGAVTSTAIASIRIRWRNGVAAGMRIVDGATVYQINAILPGPGRRSHLDLTCEVIE